MPSNTRLMLRLLKLVADATEDILEDVSNHDDAPATEDDLHAEAEAVTADTTRMDGPGKYDILDDPKEAATCEAIPGAEHVAGVTLADAEAMLKAAEFTAESCVGFSATDIFDRAAQILYGEMVANERRDQERVYYHEMLRAVCQIVDRWSDDVILCGSADNPSTSLVDAVREMARAASRADTGQCPKCEADAGLSDEFTVAIEGLPECSGHYVRTDEPPPIMPGLPPGLEERVKAKWPGYVFLAISDGTFAFRTWDTFTELFHGPWPKMIDYLEAHTPELPAEAEELETKPETLGPACDEELVPIEEAAAQSRTIDGDEANTSDRREITIYLPPTVFLSGLAEVLYWSKNYELDRADESGAYVTVLAKEEYLDDVLRETYSRGGAAVRCNH